MPDHGQKAKARSRTPPQLNSSPTREVRREPTNDSRPVFSLHNLVNNYSIFDCSDDDKAQVAQRLQELSQRTWEQIQLSDRKGTGTETIARSGVNVPIPSCIGMHDTILSVRCTQKARLIGFRRDAVFHIIWVDTAHAVYDG